MDRSVEFCGDRLPVVEIADSDGDGVADATDDCPATPAGVSVDANGCPSDEDEDGVADNLQRQGTALASMSATGMGEAEPIADNLERAGRARNRRVEILTR